jgi:hypothetical protein
MKILLVEGSQDKNFVEQLLQRQKIHYGDDFDIEICKGIGKLLPKLKLAIETENYSQIGIIIDADTSISQYWQNTNNTMKTVGIHTLPKTPTKKGTIIEETDDFPRIGIWIMPNNTDDGFLENYISYLVRDDDKLLPLARKAVEKLINDKKNLFETEHKEKAVIYTWLAWQKKAGSSLGGAVNAKFSKEQIYILDNKKASDFIKWLQDIFKT